MESRSSIIRSHPQQPLQNVNSPRRVSSTGARRQSNMSEFPATGSVNRHAPVARQPSAQSQSQSQRKPLKRGSSTDSSALMERENRERDRLALQRQAEKVAREREEKRAMLEEEIRKERLTMFVFSAICLLCGLFWLIALSIDHWYTVTGKVDGNGTRIPGRFLWGRSGLWKVCRSEETDVGENTTCQYHSLFPTEIDPSTGMDQHVIDYQRTQVSFAIISILLLPMAACASFYTFRNKRYTYKRLTACLYFLLAITVLVVIEVVITCVSYEKVSVPYHHPKNSSFSYGFCFYVGWIVFLFYLTTAALFLAYSRKRKGDKALDDDDDEQFGGR